MKDTIQEIVDFAKEWGLHLDVNPDAHRAGKDGCCVGIPTKKQRRRKIWRGFFWVRPREDRICFYVPEKPTAAELTRMYGIELKEVNWGKLPENSSALCTKMSQVDFNNWLHRQFIQYILNARAQCCGRELKKRISGQTGGCG